MGLAVVAWLDLRSGERPEVTLNTGSPAMDDLATSMGRLETRFGRIEGQPQSRASRRPALALPGRARILLASAQESPTPSRLAALIHSPHVIRVAAIDLGTNSTRLLVADVHEGRVEEVALRQEINGSAKASTRDDGCCRFRSRECGTA